MLKFAWWRNSVGGPTGWIQMLALRDLYAACEVSISAS